MTQSTKRPGEDYRGPVLVLGATGQQGGATARALLRRPRRVRALVRDARGSGARALADAGADVVEGDFADRQSLHAAMSGADGVFSVQPNSGSPGSGVSDEDEVRFGRLVADLAVETGVRHLVYSSAAILSKSPTGVTNLDCKLEIEAHIGGLPIASTIIRPATFMELLARPDFWSSDATLTFFVSPDHSAELIAADDIGRVAAAILDDRDRFAGRVINLAGDELTGAEIGAAIGMAVGRAVAYRRFPDVLLSRSPPLKRTVRLFEEGRASGNAAVAELSRQFGQLTTLDDWLAGPARERIASAIRA